MVAAGGRRGSQMAFDPEPIPPGQLVHDPEHAGLAASGQLRRGRELFATHQCHRCHLPETILRAEGTMPELVGDTPSLVDVGGRFLGPWLYHWMLDPARLRNKVSMPRVLGPAEDEAARQLAADLTVFLSLQGAEPSEAPPVNRSDDSQLVAEGEILYENLGCIACHRFTEPSAGDDFQRVSLYYVGEKYRPGALTSFLRRPLAHHRSRRMPDFRLTDGEAAGLAKYLRASSKGRLVVVDLSTGNGERGRTAYQEHGCQACHAVTANTQPHRGEPISLGDNAASRGCLAIAPAATTVDYEFSRDDRAALTAFATFDKQSLMTWFRPRPPGDSCNRSAARPATAEMARPVISPT